jgi:hypothetical protein
MQRLCLLVCVLAGVCVTNSTFALTPAGADQDFSVLQFLAGEWEAVPKPGQGAGYCSFTNDLKGKVVVRRNHAEVSASDGRPAGTHDDLMIIYREGDPPVLRASYHDSEGHAIRYTIRAPGPDQVEFLSEPTSNAPRYRLSYAKRSDGNVSGKFEVAPPSKPEAFNTYLEWTMRHPAATTVPAKAP